MTVANDAWIRKMAKEHGMIVPFEEGLVTKGKISYGVSSYGYDVRVGSHFKIFHNLNSTLVDPKAFDSRSFMDHDGPECLIPPNSFVLAETVERFRIPRNVLCVCLGKCLTGDTRIVDAETGEYLPIRDFAGRRATIGLRDGEAAALDVTDFVPQGVQPVFELRTRLGRRIRATANHPFRTPAGWTPLSDLQRGARVAVARTSPEELSRGAWNRVRERMEVARVRSRAAWAHVPAAASAVQDFPDLALLAPTWDLVESIEPAGEEEVFDITVPGAENFLANGLFVHNSTYARCGIIVNVTPLEPEWEGVVTIEISNTTPLPAKIYSNEGIAQILFLRAAPDGICETSYADRKGKYQAQKGLTLPKVM